MKRVNQSYTGFLFKQWSISSISLGHFDFKWLLRLTNDQIWRSSYFGNNKILQNQINVLGKLVNRVHMRENYLRKFNFLSHGLKTNCALTCRVGSSQLFVQKLFGSGSSLIALHNLLVLLYLMPVFEFLQKAHQLISYYCLD